jgi:hypothetical protein
MTRFFKKFTISKYCKENLNKEKTMPRRKEHNIESNCVSFDDDCYNETSDYYTNIAAMDRKELETVKSIYTTGETFVKDITAKIKQALGV